MKYPSEALFSLHLEDDLVAFVFPPSAVLPAGAPIEVSLSSWTCPPLDVATRR